MTMVRSRAGKTWIWTPIVAATALTGLAATLVLQPGASQAATPTASSAAAPSSAEVLAATARAADFYRTTIASPGAFPYNGWSWATYTQGSQDLYRAGGNEKYQNDNLAWGAANNWGLYTGGSEIDPDTLKAAETYYDLSRNGKTAASLTAADQRIAANLKNQGVWVYDWVDALYMGLGSYSRWATRTGNSAYLDKMDGYYTWVRDSAVNSSRCGKVTKSQTGLYDATAGLWYRDCRAVDARDANGKKIFWSRGNGWVVAAIVQVLKTTPGSDPRRAKYVSMLQTMAASLKPLQGADGMWRTSLANPAIYPAPETSGTALFTYGLAYGIKAGLLDSAIYTPVVTKAWQGLTSIALQPSGFLANCQEIGDAPGNSYTAKSPRVGVSSTSSGTVNADEPPYCAGAFLLAGSAVSQLSPATSSVPVTQGKPATATSQQAGNEVYRINDGDLATRWSASPVQQSAVIDLGASTTISRFSMTPYQNRAYQYAVETSTDNATWRMVVDRRTNTIPGIADSSFAAGPVSARYVRLRVTGLSGSTVEWCSILEFSAQA